jgi:hypothetical protein
MLALTVVTECAACTAGILFAFMYLMMRDDNAKGENIFL